MRNWRGGVAALAAGGLWSVLAADNPTNTYHFAPSVVAAAWVVIEGSTGSGLTVRRTLHFGVLGALVAAGFTIGLSLAGHLDGPVFWSHADNAPVEIEHLIFAGLGAALGVLVALRQAGRPPARS